MNKFSLKKLLSNKKFTIVFSVLAAFILWLVIVINQTPNIEGTLTNISVTIDTAGTVAGELGLDEISGVSTTVTVKLSGPAYVVGNLTEKDIVVSPSLANVTAPGNYTIPLNVTKLNNQNEFSVVSITPSQLNLTFDYIDTKQIAVTPLVKGVSAVAGLVAEQPVISNADEDKITVKGPRTEMEKIDKAVALVEENEILSETKTYDGEIMLLGKNSEELNKANYSLSASSIKVSVPISKRKTVAVKPDFSNAPANYASFIKYTLSANEVNIIGPAETVDSIKEIKLSSIDFFGISKSSSSFETTPVLADGVKILDNVEKITVKIDTSAFVEKIFTVEKVKAINNEGNFSVTLTAPVKNVKICAPKDIMRTLKAESLYAAVDIGGKKAGEYTAEAAVYSESGASIWQIGSYQASITVK
ncbi:MAG: hypothetical protein KBS52_00705 [Clostridiales bacterium]|nr:hypothetical protein [Candidatus Equinaster intestinalis]